MKLKLFFPKDDHWSMTLCEIRNVLSGDKIELPIRYQFMTNLKNIIALPAEESITLSKLVFCQTVEEDSEQKPKPEILTLHIFPIPVTTVCPGPELEKDSSVKSETEGRTTPIPTPRSLQLQQPADQQNAELQDEDTETRHERNRADQSDSNEPKRCPMHAFNELLISLHGQLNWKILIKALLVFSLLLTCFLVLFVAMMHTLICLVNPQEVLSSFTAFTNKDSQELNSLKLQMKELEMSTKFELGDLKKRLGDLEDMYLRDLGMLTEASADTKSQVSQLESAFRAAYDQVTDKFEQIDSQISLKEDRKGPTGMQQVPEMTEMPPVMPQMPPAMPQTPPDSEEGAGHRFEKTPETGKVPKKNKKDNKKDGKEQNKVKKNKKKEL